MIPEGWKNTTIGAEFDIQLGKMLNKEAKAKFPQFKYLTNVNVRWGGFDLTELNEMYFSEADQKKFALRKGDLLVCEGGEIGRCAIWKEEQKNCFYQKALHRIRAKTDASIEFLKSFLEYNVLNNKLVNLVGRTSIAHLPKEKLETIPLALPPLAEQKKIAEILSTWDEAISVVGKQLETCRLQKKALMQQLLTGKKRLPGFSGEWKKVKLGDLLKEEGARNKENKITQVLSVTNHSGVIPPEEQFSKRVASENISTYKIIRKGQFGYNPSRLNVGSFGRLDRFEEGILSPLYVIFSVDETRLLSDYFLTWMSSDEATQKIKSSTQGSVRDSVNFDSLSVFSFMLPPMDEQKAIAQVFSAGEKELSLLEQKRELLNQEKNALMQQLLTGKKRVAVEE